MKHASRTLKRKRKLAFRKRQTSAGGAARDVIRADMREIKRGFREPKKSANGAARRNSATRHPANGPVFKHPATALEAAIQRYVDLFVLRRSVMSVLTASVTLKRSTWLRRN